MSNTTTADNLTVTGDLTAVDVVATGCLYTANLTNTGDVSAVDLVASGCVYTANLTATGNLSVVDIVSTGCLQGMTSCSVNGALTTNADITAVDVNASGCVTGAAAVLSEGITAACYIIDGLSTTATPLICAASYAPGATNYAWPGSLWIRTTGFDLAAGSTRANGLWYMNVSASNAAGSSWIALQALTTWEP
jgi:cytoskeletal protein CcmA (bactofilin family)